MVDEAVNKARIVSPTRAALALLALGCIARGELPDPAKPAEPKPGAAESPPAVVVVGQITDDLGQGQSGVRVRLLPSGESDETRAIGEAQTDAMGDFSIRMDNPPTGDAILILTKSGYAVLRREIRLGESGRVPFVAATLEGAYTLAGTVLTALEKKPVEQAEVTVRCAFRDWNTKTDDEGRFRMEGLPPGEAEVVIESAGLARFQRAVRIDSDMPAQEFLLKPERIVELTLVNEEGQPIAQVSVDILERGQDDFRSLISDARGRVEIRGLSFDAEELLVRLSHPDHVPTQGFGLKVALPASESRSAHTLAMVRAGRVAGVIRDLENRPRNGARVSAGADFAGDASRAWSDHEGRFEVVGLPAGKVLVTVHLSGFSPDLREVEIRAGETTTADFQLAFGGIIEGEVVFKDGRPAPGVTVLAGSWRGHSVLGLGARSDATGRFVLYDTPLDDFELVVAGYEIEDAPPVRVRAGSGSSVRMTIPDAPPGLGGVAGPGLTVSAEAPSVSVKTLDQQALALAELRGRVVFLDFWATWCGPCIMEVPALKKLHERFRKHDDFVMIGISLDHDESAFRKFVQDESIGWAQVFGKEGGAEEAARKFGAFALPSTFVLDREGKVAGAQLHGKELEDLLTRLLEDGESK